MRLTETSTHFKTMLAAVDGSANSGRAARAAVSLARMFGAELKVVHVIPKPTYATQIDEDAVGSQRVGERVITTLGDAKAIMAKEFRGADYLTKAREASKKLTDEIVSLAESQGVKASGQVLESGSVVKSIVEYATENHVDLIVIGTRGLTDFKRLVIGSVSSGVTNHAHCSVLVVR